jgi:bacillolysin
VGRLTSDPRIRYTARGLSQASDVTLRLQSRTDTEKDFDYVFVKDGNGAVLATYTGLARRGATSPCITTPTGSVQLTSDSSIVAQGFIVDAVVAC